MGVPEGFRRLKHKDFGSVEELIGRKTKAIALIFRFIESYKGRGRRCNILNIAWSRWREVAKRLTSILLAKEADGKKSVKEFMGVPKSVLIDQVVVPLHIRSLYRAYIL